MGKSPVNNDREEHDQQNKLDRKQIRQITVGQHTGPRVDKQSPGAQGGAGGTKGRNSNG